MQKVSTKEARERLKSLIDRVGSGEEVLILRHGRPVAVLASPSRPETSIPALESFRRGQTLAGSSLCESILAERKKGRP